MTQENSTEKWSANAGNLDADPGQSLGSYLQRERQKKQLTIQEVAETTRIPPEALEALEAGNKNLLPVAVFTRGFVKIYAAHLGLNQAEVLERFSNEWGTVESVTPEVLSGERMAESSPFFFSFRFYVLLLLSALIISLAYFFFQADATMPPITHTTVPLSIEQSNKQVIVEKKEMKQVIILSTAPSPKTLLISPHSAGKVILEEDNLNQDALHDSEGTESGDDSPRKTANASQLNLLKADDGLKTSSPNAASLALKPPITSSPVPEVKQQKKSIFQTVNLHIRFIKRTHISVAQDDDHPEKFIFAQGEESTWQAASHITLNIDDADAVEMTLNGSPINVAESTDGPLAITLPTDLDP